MTAWCRIVRWSIALALSLVIAPAAVGQPRGRTPTIAVLEPGNAPGGNCLRGFRDGLRTQGYVEGQNIAIEYRFAEWQPARHLSLTRELVELRPDVLWTHSPSGAQAFKQATKTVPTVVGVSNNLLEEGLVADLARPGTNLTGFELRDIELTAKRLELLKEAVPRISRVAVLVDPNIRAFAGVPGHAAPEARKLGLELRRVEAAVPEAFGEAFATMVRAGIDALLITDVPVFARNRSLLLELALRHRLPTIAGYRLLGDAGSLLSYGANVGDLCRRSADYVDRILKGAKPADLPVERADKFELVVNRASRES